MNTDFAHVLDYNKKSMEGGVSPVLSVRCQKKKIYRKFTSPPPL